MFAPIEECYWWMEVAPEALFSAHITVEPLD